VSAGKILLLGSWLQLVTEHDFKGTSYIKCQSQLGRSFNMLVLAKKPSCSAMKSNYGGPITRQKNPDCSLASDPCLRAVPCGRWFQEYVFDDPRSKPSDPSQPENDKSRANDSMMTIQPELKLAINMKQTSVSISNMFKCSQKAISSDVAFIGNTSFSIICQLILSSAFNEVETSQYHICRTKLSFLRSTIVSCKRIGTLLSRLST
jgi:hypothetical protein